jgi:O-antigen/teichoic acid export membrane protein
MALGTAGGGVGVVVAAMVGPALLTVLYRSEYAAYSNEFVWLMAGTVLANLAAFAGYGLTAARSFRSQIPLLVGESVVMCMACFILIPHYGLLGAAIAYLSAKFFLSIGSMWLLIHTTRQNNLTFRDFLTAAYEN